MPPRSSLISVVGNELVQVSRQSGGRGAVDVWELGLLLAELGAYAVVRYEDLAADANQQALLAQLVDGIMPTACLPLGGSSGGGGSGGGGAARAPLADRRLLSRRRLMGYKGSSKSAISVNASLVWGWLSNASAAARVADPLSGELDAPMRTLTRYSLTDPLHGSEAGALLLLYSSLAPPPAQRVANVGWRIASAVERAVRSRPSVVAEAGELLDLAALKHASEDSFDAAAPAVVEDAPG